jgi:hypothetical protein
VVRWKQGLRFVVAGAALTIVLQPFFWAHPLGAARAMLDARRALLTSQIETMHAVAPGQVLESPAERTAAMLGELFIVPPQLSEAGNYLQQTAPQDQAYLGNPFHRLLRGFVAGGLMLGLTLMGLLLSLWPASDESHAKQMARRWLAVAGIAEALALLWANPLPFQRYYLPLVPFVTLWGAFGASGLTRAFLLLRRSRQSQAA